MEQKLSILIIGALGTAFSYMIDNGDTMFQAARWVPVILSSAYVVWKWRKDIKKK